MQSVLNWLTSIIITITFILIPFSGGVAPVDPEAVLMTAGVISDTHISHILPIGQSFLTAACVEMNLYKPDVFIDLGDLTQDGAAEDMTRHFQIVSKLVKDDIDQIHITGNHDLGHSPMSNDEARANFVATFNEYMDYKIEHNWFSHDVNGYTFIVMGDEDPDNWDLPWYSEEQMAFLESELERATADGKPVFVLAHVPLAGIHGEEHFYDGVTEEPQNTEIKNLLSKYDNVFMLTGHIHKGMSNDINVPTFVTVEGVHYLTLPSFLMPNWPQGGITNHGMAFMIEVYEGKVILRARNCITQKWYKPFEYTVPLV